MTRNSRWLVALPLVSALALVACTAKPPSAAKIEHAQVDKEARKVTLTSDAAKHLSIKTDAVREEAVVRTLHRRRRGRRPSGRPRSRLHLHPSSARASLWTSFQLCSTSGLS
jgi:type VI protein secretion system component VasK